MMFVLFGRTVGFVKVTLVKLHVQLFKYIKFYISTSLSLGYIYVFFELDMLIGQYLFIECKLLIFI